MDIEQVEEPKLLGVNLDCTVIVKTYWYNNSLAEDKSLQNKALLYLLNSTINKACLTGPSFVTPGLLFSYVARYHKEGLRKIAIGSTAGPWMYTESKHE
jgi:hypothetical protein